MDIVDIRVPTRQVREYYTLSVNIALVFTCARCITAANDMKIFLHFWQKIVSTESKFRCEKYLDCFHSFISVFFSFIVSCTLYLFYLLVLTL